MTAIPTLPLAGLRILDLSRVLAGPWATQLLAELGADVLKVEKPGVGDETRRWSPPSCQGASGSYEESAYFLGTNRGKRSLCIDFTQAEGSALLRRLAAHCDIVIENFKPGTLTKYGLGYEDLRAVRGDVIYCSITGFGQDGPLHTMPGFDYMIQAMGGLMSITGPADGEPGAGPLRVGVPIADLMTGMYASVAILSAVHQRQQTGLGKYIDMALFDVQLAMLANQGAAYLASGKVPQRTGHQHPSIVPYQVFACAGNEPLVIAVGNDEQFRRLCRVLDLPALAHDADFATNRQRVANKARLLPELSRKIAGMPRSRLTEALHQQGIPCGPVHNIAEALTSEQAQAREMVQQLTHPQLGEVQYVACPLQMTEKRIIPRPPPMLGEHTGEVLTEFLGADDQELRRLRESAVIA